MVPRTSSGALYLARNRLIRWITPCGSPMPVRVFLWSFLLLYISCAKTRNPTTLMFSIFFHLPSNNLLKEYGPFSPPLPRSVLRGAGGVGCLRSHRGKIGTSMGQPCSQQLSCKLPSPGLLLLLQGCSPATITSVSCI